MTPSPTAPHSDGRYIAFISYAHEDEAFAMQLEMAIEAQPLPGGQAPVRVFRDRSDFTGGAYEAALDEHLGRSDALIVLCSPHARDSTYVRGEIERFARLRDPARIFPILVAGLPDNEAEALKAFPAALIEANRERGMPLGAEYRGIDLARESLSEGRFEAEWYKLLGNLSGLPPAQIREQDLRLQARRQRRRLIQGGAVAALALVLAVVMAGLWWDAAKGRRAEAAAKGQAERAASAAQVAEQRASEALLRADEMSVTAQLALARLCLMPDARHTEPLCRPEGAAPPAAEAASSAMAAASDAASAAAAAPTGTPPRAATPPVAAAPAPGPAPAPASRGQALPAPEPRARVYFHIRDPAQMAEARSLQAGFERQGLDVGVPGIQLLGVGPTQHSELRYFRDADRPEADRITQALRRSGAADLVLKKVPGYEESTQIRPRHFELWLKPGTTAGLR